MLKALPFTMSFLTGATLFVGIALGGWFTFLTPLVVFVLLPVIDELVGHDLADTAEEGADSTHFDGVVRLWAPAQAVFLAGALAFLTWGGPTAVEGVGVVISLSLVTVGGAINAAHELMHRKSAFDRALAEFLMTTATYTHFCIEHVHGHHRNVSTPLDPASSKVGQSVYAFYPQAVVGSLKSAWSIESSRNERRGVSWFTWRNRLTRYVVDVVAIYAVIGLVFGWVGLAVMAVQSVIAFSLLEVINYVEHYGLQRNEVAPGRYEKVQPRHSWNANHRISNWWLFNLQRHADHHANASRPFHNLRAIEEGPQLPFSYPTAIVCSLVPPLWHRIMDHRAVAMRQQAEQLAAK